MIIHFLSHANLTRSKALLTKTLLLVSCSIIIFICRLLYNNSFSLFVPVYNCRLKDPRNDTAHVSSSILFLFILNSASLDHSPHFTFGRKYAGDFTQQINNINYLFAGYPCQL